MRRLRVGAALPVVVLGGAAGLTARVLSDVDYFASRFATKILGTEAS